MGFAHHCHQKAEEYQLKEKAIGAAEKTKEFLIPYEASIQHIVKSF
jgi:hypothetical protein